MAMFASLFFRFRPRLALVVLSVVASFFLAGCGDDNDGDVMDVPGRVEARSFDWTAPEGDSFEVAMQAWDDAAQSKSGEHPGWDFAAQIIRKQADAGDPRARYHLGMLHFTGNGGVEFNHNSTVELVRGAAKDGYPGAHAFMALMMERGDGALFRKGDDIALEAWNKAAEGDHCGAIRRLAQAWSEGQLGLTPDAAKAAEFKARLPDCVKR